MNNCEIEEWRPIVGYEGRYEVSNIGRVKSLGRYIIGNGGTLYWHSERIMKPQKNHKGYLNVPLSKDGVYRTCTIHRLVAMAFIQNPNNYPEINHINEDKADNRVDNLEWCTAKHNNNWGTRRQRVIESNSIPLVAIRFSTGERLYFKSKAEALKLGYCPTQISQNDHIRYTGLYRNGFNDDLCWRYANDNSPMPKVVDVRHPVQGISTSDGEVLTFASLHDAAAHKYYRNSVKLSIKTGKPYKGFIWSLI